MSDSTKKLPIGYDNFCKIKKKGLYFVDKSPFIKEIIEDASEVLIITRPRRFGKTLIMSMLLHFLAHKVDEELTEGLFDNLEISKIDDGEYLKKHHGQYPVIFISLKDIKCTSFKEAFSKIVNAIANLYNEFSDVFNNSDKLTKSERALYDKIVMRESNSSDLENSLKTLSDLLCKHYGKKVYLLIDEYDSPLQSSFQYGYYKEMVNFIRGMFGSALKGNSSIEKAVVTGILRISKESIFSDLNNVKVYSTLHQKYSQYFGFTEKEVNKLLQEFSLQSKAEKIKKWYNGYQFGETIIYNPWSIANCLDDDGELQPYWLNTSENTLIKNLLATADEDTKIKLELLVRNEAIEATIDEYVTFVNFNINPSAIWSLMLSSGYLKAVSCKRECDKLRCVLLPPNYEVYLIYSSMVKEWISNRVGYETYDYFINTLLKGNIIDFTKMLKKYMLETFSVFDISGKNPEKFYHGFVLGLISSTMNTHIIKSNRESGYGRYDVLVIPKNCDSVGLIMEFKIADDCDGDLKASAQEALRQINRRNYASEIQQIGVNKIIKIGLAFWEKTVEVVFE